MIHVLTSEMVRFEIDGTLWETQRYISGAEGDGRTQLVTKVYKAGEILAEFADVHAIWNDKGKLIQPDQDDN